MNPLHIVSTPWREWPITLHYLIFLAAFGLPAKLASAYVSRASFADGLKFFFFAPTLSTRTWNERAPVTVDAVRRLLLVSVPSALALWVYYAAIRTELTGSVWLAGYAGVLPLYVLVEVFGNAIRIAYLPFGVLPPIHRQPWAARSLGDFWGRRWNRYVADWLGQVPFRGLRRNPRLGLFAAFGVSALLHEWVANLPFWIATGKSLFGSMVLYFGLQAVGLIVERQWLGKRPRLRRPFTWFVIVAPAPLVLNEAALRIFGFVK